MNEKNKLGTLLSSVPLRSITDMKDNLVLPNSYTIHSTGITVTNPSLFNQAVTSQVKSGWSHGSQDLMSEYRVRELEGALYKAHQEIKRMALELHELKHTKEEL